MLIQAKQMNFCYVWLRIYYILKPYAIFLGVFGLNRFTAGRDLEFLMHFYKVKENKFFIGRRKELDRLKAFAKLPEASILVLYGRRRVGKTELIEQAFCNRHLLKFEGLENQADQAQIEHILYQAANYFNVSHIADLKYTRWVQVLDLLVDYASSGEITLYFEELQWIANYEEKFISALKYVWDNRLRYNPKLRLILCGSSPSFMINQVIHSKALYNRSQYEMNLKPFNLHELRQFLPKLSIHEALLANLTLGGIPEYLKYLRDSSSVFLGICKNAFVKDSFFSHEYKRIFISSLRNNPHYEKVISYLSKIRFASRDEIAKYLKIKSGGSITNLLNDLNQCGFIERYKPYYLDSGRGVYRYCIRDEYLMFYYKFIHPIRESIELGQYDENPTQAINLQSYHTWMGYAFERFIRYHQSLIAKIIGFSGLPYKWGVYYNRDTIKQDPGYQIDLLFEHSKHVYTICEIKYHTDLVNSSVISEMETKLSRFNNAKQLTIKKVLITNYGVKKSVIDRAYFDNIITLEDLFREAG